MRKKYSLLILLSAIILGTIAAYSPPVKAQDEVRFYVWTGTSNVIPGLGNGQFVSVWVWIDSPISWDNTADGIAAYSLSIRVDPRALEVYEAYPAEKIRTPGVAPPPVGFLEEFLLEYGYSSYTTIPFFQWTGYKTIFTYGENNATLGHTLNIWEGIESGEALGVGAGGTAPLCQFFYLSASDTVAGPIDIMGKQEGVPSVVVEKGKYWTPDGTEYEVDVMDDGYYRAETPDISFLDLNQTSSVIGSLWHELYPEYCLEWRIDSEEDEDEILEVSDQIDMMLLPGEEYKAWYHVEWLNPDPVAGDGIVDLIVLWKEDIPVPEFPLGIGLMMLLALAIPIVYLWRTRKKET